jgi:hypothetical protein
VYAGQVASLCHFPDCNEWTLIKAALLSGLSQPELQSLASRTVRELISRNLIRLQDEGLLDVDARQIVVKDMKGLSARLETTS